MNGVALDPNFADNRTIYVYSASRMGDNPATNRVLRLNVGGDLAQRVEPYGHCGRHPLQAGSQ